jgi:hypothetical protein
MNPQPAPLTIDQPTRPAKPPIPWWGWAFAVGCALIPVLSLGGAIPAGIGFGGAGGCVAVARKAGMSTPVKALICGSILGACWIAFFALVMAVAAAKAA